MLAGAALLVAAALGWLLAIMAREPLNLTDFRYVWLAGRMWAQGGNPYGTDFVAASAAAFGPDGVLSLWVYPFSWYLPARALATLPAAAAFPVWQGVLAVLALVAGRAAYRTAFAPAPARSWLLPAALAGYACTCTAVSGLLRSGQPALVAIAGLALLLHAARTGRPRLAVLGLVLAALKPQFGLIAFAAVLTGPRGVRNCALAGASTLLLCAPALLSTDFPDQLSALLRSLAGGYQALLVNDPSRLIALPQLVYAASGWRLPLGATVLASAVGVAALGWWLRRGRTAAAGSAACIVAAILAVAFAIGVHGSDLAVLLLLLPLALRLPPAPRAIAAAGYLLLWRPENLGRVLPEAFALVGPGTVAATLICLGFAVAELQAKRRCNPRVSGRSTVR